MKVQCNRAGELRHCGGCDHAKPHERECFGNRWMGGPEFCTEWRECWDISRGLGAGGRANKTKTRCTRVKP